MVSPNDVIDWDEALQQCGEDDEFLCELLGDLRSETETQLAAIAAIIQTPPVDPFHRIMRAAHVIKGAAANLMCGQLRVASTQLEDAARQAHEAGGTASPPLLQNTVQTRYAELQLAAQNYFAFLQSRGI